MIKIRLWLIISHYSVYKMLSTWVPNINHSTSTHTQPLHPASVTMYTMNYTVTRQFTKRHKIQHMVLSGYHIPVLIHFRIFIQPTNYVSVQQTPHILWNVKVPYYVCKCLIGACAIWGRILPIQFCNICLLLSSHLCLGVPVLAAL